MGLGVGWEQDGNACLHPTPILLPARKVAIFQRICRFPDRRHIFPWKIATFGSGGRMGVGWEQDGNACLHPTPILLPARKVAIFQGICWFPDRRHIFPWKIATFGSGSRMGAGRECLLTSYSHPTPSQKSSYFPTHLPVS